MARAKTDNLTILLTDIEDFTPKTSRKTRADMVRMIEEHKSLVLPALQGRGGRLIKTIGDAFLVVFDSPTDAVLAGVEVQQLLSRHNETKHGDDRLDVRIAINAGEVTLADNDVFGEPVNITARINGIAEAGEVFFTEAVYLAMNKMEVPSSEVGLLQLKGITEKIRVYKVVREKSVGDAADKAFAESEDGLRSTVSASSGVPRRRRVAALAIDAVVCAFFIGALFSGSSPLEFDFDQSNIEVDFDKSELVSFSLFWFAYSAFFVSVWSATPGKRVCRIRLVRGDGSPLDWKVSVIRALFSVLSGNLFMLGYLWGFFSEKRLTWHDRIAGTRVAPAPDRV